MRALAVAVILLAGAVAGAQPKKPPPAGQQQDLQQRREKIKEQIRAMRAFRITQALQLGKDEKLAGQLFAVLEKYDDEFDKLLLARGDLQKRLNTTSNGKDAKAADKAIDDAAANQRALWDAQDKRLAELRKILTPQQVAKLIVVLSNFDQRIQNRLRQAARGKPGGGGGGKQPPIDDEE